VRLTPHGGDLGIEARQSDLTRDGRLLDLTTIGFIHCGLVTIT
jgi:hypothetical protein